MKNKQKKSVVTNNKISKVLERQKESVVKRFVSIRQITTEIGLTRISNKKIRNTQEI